MRYYIQTPGNHHNKARIIAEQHGGTLLAKAPRTYADIPADKALVCVVDNGPFEAAAVAVDEGEFKVFTDPLEERPRQYVVIDKAKAYELSGYEPK